MSVVVPDFRFLTRTRDALIDDAEIVTLLAQILVEKEEKKNIQEFLGKGLEETGAQSAMIMGFAAMSVPTSRLSAISPEKVIAAMGPAVTDFLCQYAINSQEYQQKLTHAVIVASDVARRILPLVKSRFALHMSEVAHQNSGVMEQKLPITPVTGVVNGIRCASEVINQSDAASASTLRSSRHDYRPLKIDYRGKGGGMINAAAHDRVKQGLQIGTDDPSPIRSDVMLDLATILPPPPALKMDRINHLKWISGKSWHPLALSFSFKNKALLDPDEIMDLETEIHSNAADLLARSGVKPAQELSCIEQSAKTLSSIGRDLGVGRTDDMARLQFLKAFDRIHAHHFPAEHNALRSHGAKLEIHEDLADVIRSCLDVVTFWIGDGYEGEEQNYTGTLSGSYNLVPGVALERAVYLHLKTGVAMPDAILDAMIELREAQAGRIYGDDAAISLSDCEKLFYYAYDAPITALKRDEEPAYSM